MKVLVTGGAGFIGSHLVDRFLKEGFEVRILDSLDPKVHPRGKPDYIPKNVEFIQGDLTDRETLLFALKGADIISHQGAYQDYMPDFSRFFEVNAVATALIFELIVQHRLSPKKVIVASSQAIYGEGQYECPRHGFFLPQPRSQEQLTRRDWEIACSVCGRQALPRMLEESYLNPYNQYAVSKLAGEKCSLGLGWLHGIPTVALRYSITQGARQSLYNHYSGACRIFCSRAMRGEPLIIYEDGQQTRDFTHIKDVVEANMLVLERDEADFQAFNVGCGKATTIHEYADQVLRRMPYSAGVRVSGEYRLGDNRHSVSNVDKLKKLGWQPRHGLAAILDDFLDWVNSIGGIPDGIPDAYADMRRAGVVLTAQAN
ncbi:MAG TPA: NAD-dependent epimerase/dehydratase family protein [Terriglobales bacterium]|nr:NAD-dependent epimerase/dehydratase family protein [Terriglobales bacterium]